MNYGRRKRLFFDGLLGVADRLMLQPVEDHFGICQEADVFLRRADAVGDVQRELAVDGMLAAQILCSHLRRVHCAEEVIDLAAVAVSGQKIFGDVRRHFRSRVRGVADRDRISGAGDVCIGGFNIRAAAQPAVQADQGTRLGAAVADIHAGVDQHFKIRIIKHLTDSGLTVRIQIVHFAKHGELAQRRGDLLQIGADGRFHVVGNRAGLLVVQIAAEDDDIRRQAVDGINQFGKPLLIHENAVVQITEIQNVDVVQLGRDIDGGKRLIAYGIALGSCIEGIIRKSAADADQQAEDNHNLLPDLHAGSFPKVCTHDTTGGPRNDGIIDTISGGKHVCQVLSDQCRSPAQPDGFTAGCAAVPPRTAGGGTAVSAGR